jgi:glycosyltransferase involved in cell wall biosynthesis
MPDIDVTVIVPTFNSQKVIKSCLESIVSQVGASFEIVVVDGLSADGTLDIAQQYSACQMTVISEPDQGIYDAINKGVKAASGGLIGVLGSDDTYEDGVFSTLLKHKRSGAQIIAGLTKINGEFRRDEPYRAAALISGIPFGHNAMFASRDAYEAVGLYDLRYRICADAQWVHRAIRLGIRCQKLNTLFVDFGADGTSSTNADEVMNEAYEVIRENFPFLTLDEAKYLLYAVRKWGPSAAVSSLIKKYGDFPLFVEALSDAFTMNDGGFAARHQRGSVHRSLRSFFRNIKRFSR